MSNDIKMSDVFPEAFQVEHNNSFEVQDASWYSYGEWYRSSAEQDSALECAVLNHDRLVEELQAKTDLLALVVVEKTGLVEENAELREALQSALNIKNLWLPCGSFGDNPPENYQEIEALHLMAKDFEKLLNK